MEVLLLFGYTLLFGWGAGTTVCTVILFASFFESGYELRTTTMVICGVTLHVSVARRNCNLTIQFFKANFVSAICSWMVMAVGQTSTAWVLLEAVDLYLTFFLP